MLSNIVLKIFLQVLFLINSFYIFNFFFFETFYTGSNIWELTLSLSSLFFLCEKLFFEFDILGVKMKFD